MGVELISAIVYSVITTITTIFGFIKSQRNKTLADKLNAINKFNEVLIDLPDVIDKVEDEVVGVKQGAIRKTLVMQNAQLECGSRNVQFDLPKVSNQIEKILKTPQKKKDEQVKTDTIDEVRTEFQ